MPNNKSAKRNKAKQKKKAQATKATQAVEAKPATAADAAAEVTTTLDSHSLADGSSSTTPSAFDTPSATSTDDMVAVVDIPGKGKGVVALLNIPAGTRITKEAPYMIMTAGNPSEVDTNITKALTKLDEKQRSAFQSLHNADPSHPCANYAIFNTNALPLGVNSPKAAVYPTLCRINHSCLPNAHHSWNENLKMETFHALRNIRRGEEVTIAYTVDGPRAQRRALLQNKFGFECQCEACGASDEEVAASDARRRQIADLDERIGQPMRLRMMPGTVRAECACLVALLEEEYRGLTALAARTHYDAFQVAVCHRDLAGARKYATEAYECRVLVEGEDGPETRRMRKFSQNPRSHAAWGMC